MMNKKPIDQAKDPDFRHAVAAMERAQQRAYEVAKQTHTPLVVQRGGRVVLVDVK